MSRINWKELLEHKGDALLTLLYDTEKCFWRAIQGIWFFIIKKLPELLRELLAWLYETFFYACRVAIRLSRVIGLFLAWAFLVFIPVSVCPNSYTVAWLLLALVGSVWGAQREFKKHKPAKINKEVSHARA